MVSSMTGYAAVTRELAAGTLALELKSVNSRFLDVQFRIAEELRTVEPALRELAMAGSSTAVSPSRPRRSRATSPR